MPQPAADRISRLIDERVPGHTLPQAFYRDPEIFAADVAVLGSRWLLVDHTSRIPSAGDWFLADFGPESFIVARGADEQVRTFHNVCRHRGSRICLEAAGNTSLFVCPYHAWSYRLDGTVKSARAMGPAFDPEDHSLLEVNTRIVQGLIFISPTGDGDAADELLGEYESLLEFHGMGRAKVAARRTYPTAANWKLVVENFLECYHCLPAHAEYTAVHSREKLEAIGAGPGSGDPAAVERFQARLEEWREKADSLGHPTVLVERGADSLQMSQMSRSPIGPVDRLSETMDGQLGCTRLMGSFVESDGGQTGCSFSPVSYVLANCDSAFMITFRPVGPLSTNVEAVWLVDEDAVEGVDYDVDRLSEVWHITLEQDKTITENNQIGVLSSGYRPGPYALGEVRVDTFVQWYLAALGESTGAS